MSQLASTLLQVLTPEKQPAPRKGAVPLFMTFPVNSQLAPFLVTRATTGTEHTLWVERTKAGQIKAGLREITNLEEFYGEVVERVRVKGLDEHWGNVHPLTRTGLIATIDHLNDYGFDDSSLEMLAHPQIPWHLYDPKWDNRGKGMVLSLLGLPVQPAPWLPQDTVVVLPRDREMVGFVYLTLERVASVVHNAARGLGIATSRTATGEGGAE